MNSKQKELFNDLCYYCNERGLEIISVYFKENKALVINVHTNTKDLLVYEDNTYWTILKTKYKPF